MVIVPRLNLSGLSISAEAVAGLEVVAGEEGGYGHGLFAFELHAVKGEVAVAGGDGEADITRADPRLRGNRISESLGHGYGACALHEGATGRRDVRRTPSYPAPASLPS